MAKKKTTENGTAPVSTARMINPMDYCTRIESIEEDVPRFLADQNDVYPPLINAFIMANGGDSPFTPAGSDADHYRAKLGDITRMKRALRDALLPLKEVEAFPERRKQRELVLETIRLWFTNELHQLVGGDGTPMHVVWTAHYVTCPTCQGAGKETHDCLTCAKYDGEGKLLECTGEVKDTRWKL